MIYTVTLNPSIDFIVRLESLKLGAVNRMTSDDKFAGGKGINVSRVLKQIGAESTALGFVGGFTGKFITEALKNEAIQTNFTDVSEDTRINVKVKSDLETEINGTGPQISNAELADLKAKLKQLTAEDIVVFAGSAPKSLGNTVYEELIAIVTESGADFVIDIEGKTLLHALPKQPLVIKPNNHELGDIYNVTLKTIEEIIPYGERLLEDGAKHVLISMAGDGALLFTKDGNYFAKPIIGKVKNSVGAGDSMIAGFVGTFHQTQDAIESFKYGVACGTATAFSVDLATADFIKEILQQVSIEQLKH
ncbi:MAG: 1-phosphofructokinase [Streptococcaceae bacterium]|jgi:1-phosphofructokinase|nr:1-phosphofructokinase [Streptococcaceae bacterium]